MLTTNQLNRNVIKKNAIRMPTIFAKNLLGYPINLDKNTTTQEENDSEELTLKVVLLNNIEIKHY